MAFMHNPFTSRTAGRESVPEGRRNGIGVLMVDIGVITRSFDRGTDDWQSRDRSSVPCVAVAAPGVGSSKRLTNLRW